MAQTTNRDLDKALRKLTRLAQRTLGDHTLMNPEEFQELHKLFLDAIDWWDWSEEGRRSWLDAVHALHARFTRDEEA